MTRRDSPGNPAHGVGPCPACGKVSYTTRAGARRAGKRLYAGQHMNAYACPDRSGYWHIGHLPKMVRAGWLGRASITTPPRDAP